MALIVCGECGSEVSTTANACPKCGAKVPKTKWWLWIPLGIFGLMLIYGLATQGGRDEVNREKDRRAVEMCRLDLLANKGKTVSEQVCREMAAIFQRKWNTAP